MKLQTGINAFSYEDTQDQRQTFQDKIDYFLINKSVYVKYYKFIPTIADVTGTMFCLEPDVVLRNRLLNSVSCIVLI